MTKMLVKELCKVMTWKNQLFDVRNGRISNEYAVWEYNLPLVDVVESFGERRVHQVFSDTTMEYEELMTDYLNGLVDEPETEELTNISIVLENELKEGDRVIINDLCDTIAWRGKVGTVKGITDTMVSIKMDKKLPDGAFPYFDDLVLYKYKVDNLFDETIDNEPA